MAVGEAMLNGVPVPTALLNPASSYQVKVVPVPATAVKEMFPASDEQKLFLSTLAEVGAVGFAVIVTATEAAVEVPQVLTQAA